MTAIPMRRATVVIPIWILAVVLTPPPCRAASMPGWVEAVTPEEGLVAFPHDDLVELYRCCTVKVDDSGGRRCETWRVFHLRRGDPGAHAVFVEGTASWRKVREMKGWGRDASGRVTDAGEPVRTTLFDQALYSDQVQFTLRVPNPGPGSVYAVQVVVKESLDSVRGESWPLLQDLPVVRWEYHLVLPDGWWAEAFFAASAGAELAPMAAEAGEDGTCWRGNPVHAAWDPEPFAPPDAEEIPFLLVRYHGSGKETEGLTSWKAVSAWFSEYSRSAFAQQEEALSELANRLAPFQESPGDRARRLGEWVRDSVGYVQISLKDGGWRPHLATEVYRNRFGDCKDMAHLAVGLMRTVGVAAFPVLTNIGGYRSVRPSFPSPTFNHCIVALNLPERGWLFFDPTAKSVPFGEVPASLQGAWSLVVGSELDTALVRIPQSPAERNRSVVRARVALGPDQSAGEVEMTGTGVCAADLRSLRQRLTEEQLWHGLQDALRGKLPRAEITSLEWAAEGAAGDTVELRYAFVAPLPGKRVGDLLLVDPDPFGASGEECFQSATRRRDFDFGYPVHRETTVDMRVPSEWASEDLPPSLRVETGPMSFSWACTREGDWVRLQRTEEIRQSRLPAAESELVRDWGKARCTADRWRLAFKMRGP